MFMFPARQWKVSRAFCNGKHIFVNEIFLKLLSRPSVIGHVIHFVNFTMSLWAAFLALLFLVYVIQLMAWKLRLTSSCMHLQSWPHNFIGESELDLLHQVLCAAHLHFVPNNWWNWSLLWLMHKVVIMSLEGRWSWVNRSNLAMSSFKKAKSSKMKKGQRKAKFSSTFRNGQTI